MVCILNHICTFTLHVFFLHYATNWAPLQLLHSLISIIQPPTPPSPTLKLIHNPHHYLNSIHAYHINIPKKVKWKHNKNNCFLIWFQFLVFHFFWSLFFKKIKNSFINDARKKKLKSQIVFQSILFLLCILDEVWKNKSSINKKSKIKNLNIFNISLH